MKKVIFKSTLAVVAVATSCLGAWRAYGSYENVDNSLLMENLEALAQDEGGENGDLSWWDKFTDGCYDTAALLKSKQCPTSETSAGYNNGIGVNIPVPTEGGVIPVGANVESGYNYNHTTYGNKSQFQCESDWVWNHCDRREQTTCEGVKYGSRACG